MGEHGALATPPIREGMEYSIDEVMTRLVEQYGYSEAQARNTVTKLARSSEEIREAFWRWWQTGELDSPAIQGYTVKQIVDDHGINPVGAYLALDWLRRDPQQARKFLERGWDRLKGPHFDVGSDV
jgi:hypothetical protein